MTCKSKYKSIALNEISYSKLKEVSEKENRPIGRELSGLANQKYKKIFNSENF